MPLWSRWWQERKTTENKNEGVTHRDITENKRETNQDTLKKVTEELPDDKYPVGMEECVNDDLDDENKHNLIEENKTKFNDEYEYITEVNNKEEM